MEAKSHSITLSAEIMEKLQSRVSFSGEAGINAFLTDAINTYVHLAELANSGGQIQFLGEGRDVPVNLKFPFDVSST